MLYVTTRTERDAFSVFRALTCDLGPDGGQFLPILAPSFGEDALRAVAERSFNQNVAHILNLFYRKNLTAWDVELLIGKRPLELLALNRRTLIAQIWRHSEWSFDEFVQRLFRLLALNTDAKPSQWFVMSVRIAVLFGIFGELMAQGLATAERPLDVSVPSYDFQYPMAVWYARSWGLPIGSIVCCCNENNAPWSLLHQGEMRTDVSVRHTYTAACDQAVPGGLERLIYETLGPEEIRRYAGILEKRRPYKLEPEQRDLLRSGISVSVISQRRMAFMIPNLCRSGQWIPDPYAAMAYAGLVDHRSRAGETGVGLVISEENPIHSAGMLSQVLGVSPDVLRQRLGGGQGG